MEELLDLEAVQAFVLVADLFLTDLEMLDFGAGFGGIDRRDRVFSVRHCFYNGPSTILPL